MEIEHPASTTITHVEESANGERSLSITRNLNDDRRITLVNVPSLTDIYQRSESTISSATEISEPEVRTPHELCPTPSHEVATETTANEAAPALAEPEVFAPSQMNSMRSRPGRKNPKTNVAAPMISEPEVRAPDQPYPRRSNQVPIKPTIPKPTNKKYQIFVRRLTGQIITLEVEVSTTVLSVKEQVGTRLEMPVEQIHLEYGGRTLNNEQPISFYKIASQATVNMVVKLRGGFSH